MYIPFHYQISEYDCVPTAMINAISYLFHRKEIPPMVIRHIYLYCMDTAIEDEWVYCFDSYKRNSVHRMQGKIKLLKPVDERAPNLKIKKSWLGQTQTNRFCLGPFHIRESLLIWRNP